MRSGALATAGSLNLKVTRLVPPIPHGKKGFVSHALPHRGLPREVNMWRWKNLARVSWQFAKISAAVFVARKCGVATAYGRLSLHVNRNGETLDLGIASYRVVTDAGVAYIVDAFQNSVEVENLKYHGFGTGTNAEAAGDTTLQTELTTEYATDNTRPTGTTTEGATANIYRTVATLDPDSAVAITEHGVFHQAANSGGTLLDRSKFSAVNLAAAGDTLAATYELTFTSGG